MKEFLPNWHRQTLQDKGLHCSFLLEDERKSESGDSQLLKQSGAGNAYENLMRKSELNQDTNSHKPNGYRYSPSEFQSSDCSAGSVVGPAGLIDQIFRMDESLDTLLLACDTCIGGFQSSQELDIHLRTHHASPRGSEKSLANKLFPCEGCGLTFYPKEVFIRHKCRMKNQSKSFLCDQCDKRFQCKSSLQVHRKTLHCSTKQFQCLECEKRFHILSDLKRHELMHTGERPFICPACEKGFTCKSSLHAHQKSAHTVGKLLQCSRCDKSFHLVADLSRHIRTHTGERPFTCSHCVKGFTCKSSLKAHEKMHVIGKPFKCQFCQKSFHLQMDLSRHERTHTGVKPFQCDVCQKGFVCKSTLTTHIRLIHTRTGDKQTSPDPESTEKFVRKRTNRASDSLPTKTDNEESSDQLSDLRPPGNTSQSVENNTDHSPSNGDGKSTMNRRRQRKSKFVQRLMLEAGNPDNFVPIE